MENAGKCTEEPVNLLHILKINHLRSNILHLLETGFVSSTLTAGEHFLPDHKSLESRIDCLPCSLCHNRHTQDSAVAKKKFRKSKKK